MIIGFLTFTIYLFIFIIVFLLSLLRKIYNRLEFLADRVENSKLRNGIIDLIHKTK